MTNFERWKVELENFIKVEGSYPAIVNGKPSNCSGIPCCECELNVLGTTCQIEFINWLFKEYKEPERLTKRQKHLLKALQTGYVARDKSGVLAFYERKPERHDYKEWRDGGMLLCSRTQLPDFPFIKWEDEPYSVEEMLTWEVEGE